MYRFSFFFCWNIVTRIEKKTEYIYIYIRENLNQQRRKRQTTKTDNNVK